MTMSLNHKHSQQTVVKALHWLDKQPDNWINHITDSNIAVKMYLKSQKNSRENPSAFEKELKTLLKPEKISLCQKSNGGQQNNFDKENLQKNTDKTFGARLTKQASPLSALLQKPSPPSQHPEEQLSRQKTNPPPAKEEQVFSQKTNPSPAKEEQPLSQKTNPWPENKRGFFCLDTASQQAVEQTKKELNMERQEEALRALIQLGRRLLKKLC